MACYYSLFWALRPRVKQLRKVQTVIASIVLSLSTMACRQTELWTLWLLLIIADRQQFNIWVLPQAQRCSNASCQWKHFLSIKLFSIYFFDIKSVFNRKVVVRCRFTSAHAHDHRPTDLLVSYHDFHLLELWNRTNGRSRGRQVCIWVAVASRPKVCLVI